MTRIALAGATGRMGHAIADVIAEDPLLTLTAAYGRDDDEALGTSLRGITVTKIGPIDADVVIDFTRPDGTRAVIERCAAAKCPLVSGTTGLGAEELAALDALAADVPVVWAPNMSVGVTLLFHLAEQASRLLGPDFDAEIVEMHHRHKVDAPSGTAVRLAERVAAGRGLDPAEAVVHGRSGHVGPRPDGEIGVMTLRGGSVIGDHTLVLAGPGERLELSHRAQDRSIFARGAVRAARWVVAQAPGRYEMPHVLGIDALG